MGKKENELMRMKNVKDDYIVTIKKMEEQIKEALPKLMDVSRFSRCMLTAIKNSPAIMKCDKITVLASMMMAAQLGLEPNSPLGQCYLIPYGGECQFQFGYKGWLNMVRRSGEVGNIYAEVVYENDEFELNLGLDRDLKHKPELNGDRGKPVMVYAVAQLKDGDKPFIWMPKSEVESIKEEATKKMKYANMSPWNHPRNWSEMWKKTAVKRLCKLLPLSVEVQNKLAQDETVKKEIASDMTQADGYNINNENPSEEIAIAEPVMVDSWWKLSKTQGWYQYIPEDDKAAVEVGVTMERLDSIRDYSIKAMKTAEGSSEPFDKRDNSETDEETIS